MESIHVNGITKCLDFKPRLFASARVLPSWRLANVGQPAYLAVHQVSRTMMPQDVLP